MAASAWINAPARTLVLSDERLARLAARGDERAFGAIVERHQGALTRYCSTVLRHGADAEDAVQNEPMSAHPALAAGTVPMRVKPWLYRIAHNEAISLARTRRPADELDERELPVGAAPEEAVEIRHRLGELLSDLRALTERQREALVLRELSGLDYAQIAQTLGVSEAAAQQTVFEARSALQSFGEGRALACEGIQRALSDCDGMRLRTRTFRAHLRDCDGCRAFEIALRARRRDLGLLFPPTGAAGGLLATLGRLLGNGDPIIAGLGLKGAVLGLVVLGGGGAVVATAVEGGGGGAPAPLVAPAAVVEDAAVMEPETGADRNRPSGRPVSGGDDRDASPSREGRRPQHVPGNDAGPSGDSGGGGSDRSGDSAPGSSSPSRGPAPSAPAGDDDGGNLPRPPVRAPQPVQDVVDQVSDVADDVLDTVEETVAPVTEAVQDTVTTVTDTADDVSTPVADAVEDATGVKLPGLLP